MHACACIILLMAAWQFLHFVLNMSQNLISQSRVIKYLNYSIDYVTRLEAKSYT